jgi:hypothetical protein
MLNLLPFALVGTKSLVEDIEPEILNAVDLVINYGRQKYNTPRSVLRAERIDHWLRIFADPSIIRFGRTSSTMIDFKNLRLLRYGAGYDVIKDAMKRFYEIDFPEDPGKDVLFSGHAVEQQNSY